MKRRCPVISHVFQTLAISYRRTALWTKYTAHKFEIDVPNLFNCLILPRNTPLSPPFLYLWISWFPRLHCCGRCRNIEITITIMEWEKQFGEKEMNNWISSVHKWWSAEDVLMSALSRGWAGPANGFRQYKYILIFSAINYVHIVILGSLYEICGFGKFLICT